MEWCPGQALGKEGYGELLITIEGVDTSFIPSRRYRAKATLIMSLEGDVYYLTKAKRDADWLTVWIENSVTGEADGRNATVQVEWLPRFQIE